mgnify:CR=1 FL=1
MLSDETKQKLEEANLAEAEAAKILEEEINKLFKCRIIHN